VYLCVSFLVFCPGQQKDEHLPVNVAVDTRGDCDRRESDLEDHIEDHKKTREDSHTIAWKKLEVEFGIAAQERSDSQHCASARTALRLILKSECHRERFCLSRQKVVIWLDSR
jgi:hypothetical protein